MFEITSLVQVRFDPEAICDEMVDAFFGEQSGEKEWRHVACDRPAWKSSEDLFCQIHPREMGRIVNSIFCFCIRLISFYGQFPFAYFCCQADQ